MKSYEEKESFPVEEEQDLSPIAEAILVEDPAVTKTHKKAAVGLTIPSIILLIISLAMLVFAFLMQGAAKNELEKKEVIGGVFLLFFFFVPAGSGIITSIISLGLSIGLLCNNIKKKLHIWYPILFLSLSLCFIGGLIALIATL